MTLHFMRHTPAVSQLPSHFKPIPGVVDAYAFRDDSMGASIYVAMAVDAEAIDAALGHASAETFALRGAYFDESWRREGGFDHRVNALLANETRSARGRALEFVRRVRVPCDRYHVALAFEDSLVRVRAVGRRDADARRFADDALTLSDVLLFRDETPAGDDVVVERAGLRMRPNVERSYGRGDRVRAYVEVYNLPLAAAERGRASSYELRFAIFPARKDEPDGWMDWGRRAADWVGGSDESEAIISQTFQREGRSHEEHESIVIDIDVLDNGRYDLVIDVLDKRSGQRATARAPFWKDAGPLADRRQKDKR
jgi:hypothetical protein